MPSRRGQRVLGSAGASPSRNHETLFRFAWRPTTTSASVRTSIEPSA